MNGVKAFLAGISLEGVLTLIGFLIAIVAGVRETLKQRRESRAAAAATADLARLKQLDGIHFTVKDVRLSTADDKSGTQQLTLSLVLGEDQAKPADQDPGRSSFPKNVTVINVTEQPFGVVQPGVRRAAQTAGDEDAGFHRFGDRGWPAGARVETYRWGRLAASVFARLMWLILLPLQLGNVTLWLSPVRGRVRRYLGQLLCRLLALTLTASVALALAGVALDLAGWQCVFRETACGGVGNVLPDELTGPENVGRRMAAMALIPIFLICLVWYLARVTWRDYEQHPDPAWPRTAGGWRSALASPQLWESRHSVRRLRSLHVSTAFITLDLVLLAGLSEIDFDESGRLLFAACVTHLALCAIGLALPSVVSEGRGRGGADTFVAFLRAFGILLTLLSLWYAATADPPIEPFAGTALPYYGEAVTYLFAAQLMLGFAMLILAVIQRPRDWTVADLGAPVVASLAIGAAAALEATLVYRTADYLSGQNVTANVGEQGSYPALPYQWAGLGFAVMLGLATLAAIIVVRPNQRDWIDARKQTDLLFPGKRPLSPRRAARIDRANARSTVVGRVVLLLILASIPIAVLSVIGAIFVIKGSPPPRVFGASWFNLSELGRYIIGAAVLALLLLAALTFANKRVQTVFGFLWELGTLWPRTCHPLAPPCYAARIVPELAVRINEVATAKPSAAVIVVGYGQGSVLAVAAVLQLPEAARKRVALVTAGSPVGLLYKRIFRQHFNDGLFQELADGLSEPDGGPRWVNLHRQTDPVSGPIGIAGVDRLLRDPVQFEIPPDGGKYLDIHGHSNYEADPDFARTIESLARRA